MVESYHYKVERRKLDREEHILWAYVKFKMGKVTLRC